MKLDPHEAALWALIAICLVLIGAILTPGTVGVDERGAILAAIAGVLSGNRLAHPTSRRRRLAGSPPVWYTDSRRWPWLRRSTGPGSKKQLTGSALGPFNCNMASAAMMADRDTLGAIDVTPDAMRKASGDTSGGTSQGGANTALAKYGINVHSYDGHDGYTMAKFVADLKAGCGIMAAGDYDQLPYALLGLQGLQGRPPGVRQPGPARTATSSSTTPSRTGGGRASRRARCTGRRPSCRSTCSTGRRPT